MNKPSESKSLTRICRSWALRLAWPVVIGALIAVWWAAGRPSTWMAQAVRSRTFVVPGVVLIAGAAALSAVLGAMARLGRARLRRLGADRRGSAVLEFVLLFPIAMGIVLVMVQSALLMTGTLLVHYGATCAARSAIVWVPADLRPWGEPPNVVGPPGGSAKLQRIRHAAVLAILPAGARSGRFAAYADASAVRHTLEGVFDAYRRPAPGWLDTLLEARYGYVDDENHTWVELSAPTWVADDDADDAADGLLDGRFDNGSSIPPYGPREPITVTVHHRLYLAIPYANRLFGEPLEGHPGHYATEIVVRTTLMNQGRHDDVIVELRPDAAGDLLLPR
ncbi:MAG: hypothetical protein GX591_12325 [Planctomycetes bacterium]|nr:hypothetical protein [Planctomycetota bacterium]